VLLFAPAERQIIDLVSVELTQLDRYAREPLSLSFLKIVEKLEQSPEHELRCETEAQFAEMSLSVHLDVQDPEGKPFPEVRLQYRSRSRFALARKTRQLVGALPRARLLVLTPSGYRLTTLRNLELRRFEHNRRPRLAPYLPASVRNLSGYLLDMFGAALFGSAS